MTVLPLSAMIRDQVDRLAVVPSEANAMSFCACVVGRLANGEQRLLSKAAPGGYRRRGVAYPLP